MNAICPVCKATFSLSPRGTVMDPHSASGKNCAGTGMVTESTAEGMNRWWPTLRDADRQRLIQLNVGADLPADLIDSAHVKQGVQSSVPAAVWGQGDQLAVVQDILSGYLRLRRLRGA